MTSGEISTIEFYGFAVNGQKEETMIHRVLGWFAGFLLVSIQGKNVERFINLCKNNRFDLWQISFAERKGQDCLFFKIALHDFYKLRPIARKCKVHPLIIRRYGFPFMVGKMKRHKSFCLGVLCFVGILFFLSGRIWGIYVRGELYHSKESLLRTLEQMNVYGGMAANDLTCNEVEEKLRHIYTDIGWASVELKGSKIYVRVKEVTIPSSRKKKQKGHLIAREDAKVVSIVTRKGTAKKRSGNQVKKGDILISGAISIYGDGDTLYRREYVHADGDVILETTQEYSDSICKKQEKRSYTGRTKNIFEWQIAGHSFFCHNPLKNLETYKKYDIIREGGKVCPEVSLRFPLSCYKKTYREYMLQSDMLSKKEAKKALLQRYKRYIRHKKEKGYALKTEKIRFYQKGNAFLCKSSLVFWRKEDTYRKINKKNKTIYKEKENNGNNGNNSRNTGGA